MIELKQQASLLLYCLLAELENEDVVVLVKFLIITVNNSIAI